MPEWVNMLHTKVHAESTAGAASSCSGTMQQQLLLHDAVHTFNARQYCLGELEHQEQAALQHEIVHRHFQVPLLLANIDKAVNDEVEAARLPINVHLNLHGHLLGQDARLQHGPLPELWHNSRVASQSVMAGPQSRV